jgi:biotin carboxyl carrier protein
MPPSPTDPTATLALQTDGTWLATVGTLTLHLTATRTPQGALLLRAGDGRQWLIYANTSTDGARWLAQMGAGPLVRLSPPAPVQRSRRATTSGTQTLNAPMPALVTQVLVAIGDKVQRGQTLMVLEAMKMEQRLNAPTDGVVRALNVQVGELVGREQALVTLEAGAP